MGHSLKVRTDKIFRNVTTSILETVAIQFGKLGTRFHNYDVDITTA